MSRSSLLSEETLLRQALNAFSWAHSLEIGWANRHFDFLTEAGISSIGDLSQGVKDETVNLDLELFGTPPEDRISDEVSLLLRSFLPGPVGLRAFRLAQKAAIKAEKGSADVKYVHRAESGKPGEEKFSIRVGKEWILHVDCAGFVRHVLKHVTKDAFVMALSDRDFMRAKDFFRFFHSIPYSVRSKEEIPATDRRMKWRRVEDLRMVIAGDVIVYRPRGNAAGGAAFTENDRKDLKHLLKAVKTAEIWKQEEAALGDDLVTRNCSKDPQVKLWVEATRERLRQIGITTIKEFRSKFSTINKLMQEKGETLFPQSTLNLMKECLETRALNTGHIVFASGPAVSIGENECRIRVVHSTKFGKKDKNGNVIEGVQEHYRRFRLIEHQDGSVTYTRPMQLGPSIDDEGEESDDNPQDDMEEDEEDENSGESGGEEPDEGRGDDLAGIANVEVLAARMSF